MSFLSEFPTIPYFSGFMSEKFCEHLKNNPRLQKVLTVEIGNSVHDSRGISLRLKVDDQGNFYNPDKPR